MFSPRHSVPGNPSFSLISLKQGNSKHFITRPSPRLERPAAEITTSLVRCFPSISLISQPFHLKQVAISFLLLLPLSSIHACHSLFNHGIQLVAATNFLVLLGLSIYRNWGFLED
ncbi:hypothetical protein AAC387_Pa07g2339 [Persea americana]